MVSGHFNYGARYVAPRNWIPTPVWVGIAGVAAFGAYKAFDHLTAGKTDDPPAKTIPWPSTAAQVKPEHILGKTIAELSAQLIRYDDSDGDNRVSLTNELPANDRRHWIRDADESGNNNGYASTAELTSYLADAPVHWGSPLPEPFGYSHAPTIIKWFLPEAQ